MKHVPIIAVAVCTLAAGCSIRSERVVERPVPVPAERTVVYSEPVVTPAPTTTTVYTTR